MVKLIADSGSTKAEWCLLQGKKQKTFTTQGLSPYFLDRQQISAAVQKELIPSLGKTRIDEVYFYGTGCKAPANRRLVKSALQKVFPEAAIEVETDLFGAALAVCGRTPGVACILGTGSNSCYFNGRKIVKNSPGLGYILGDEGSGAYLGRKVLQYYLYDTFDEDLRARFDATYVTNTAEILDSVYKKPLANRYLASFALFLAENRGHYMVENIIEDGLNDFFFQHIVKYREAWTLPVHFIGGVAFGFRDVVKDLCANYEITLGRILQNPMDGLTEYHRG